MADIDTALAAVMADVDHVAKRDRNEHQRFLFRGIDAVVNAVGPVLRKHGVTVRPTVDQVTYETVQTSGGKASTACRLLVTYTFRAGDGSEVATSVAAEAWDSGDKAAPKAMSVAFRTALLQALCLPTDEPDPDSHTYERSATQAPQDPPNPTAKDAAWAAAGLHETEGAARMAVLVDALNGVHPSEATPEALRKAAGELQKTAPERPAA